MTDAAPSRGGLSTRRVLLVGLAAFAAAGVVFFLLGSRLSPDVPRPRGYPVRETALPSEGGTFLLTLAVEDQEHWVPVDLGAGRLAATVDDADLAARRNVIRAPHGALDLGAVDLAQARVPPGARWIADEDARRGHQNAGLDWYEYSYWTHVLTSRGHVHAIRRRDGSVAFVKVESYYCEPEGSGCLTLRYRLQ